MDFTFGIVTAGNNENIINEIITSIENERIPRYEIIIIGQCNITRNNVKVISFDETIKKSWITKKKNLITSYASYENIVYLHDYIKLTPGWYAGQLKAGNTFSIRMDRILNFNGERFRDWCICPDFGGDMDKFIERECLIPYDMTHLSKYMYISGAYWIAKKEVMIKYPLDELLSWGEGEDVYWSMSVRKEYNFDMNIHSEVIIMKPGKDRVFSETSTEKIKILNDFARWLN